MKIKNQREIKRKKVKNIEDLHLLHPLQNQDLEVNHKKGEKKKIVEDQDQETEINNINNLNILSK